MTCQYQKKDYQNIFCFMTVYPINLIKLILKISKKIYIFINNIMCVYIHIYIYKYIAIHILYALMFNAFLLFLINFMDIKIKGITVL